MTNTKTLFLLAGAALSISASAMAQTSAVSRDEVRAIVAEMLSDAETRTSLLQGGTTGGHDGKFFVASSDGNFRLNVGGFTQFRYIFNNRDDENTNNEVEPGFQMRRTRIEFSGHVVNPNLNYFISGEWSGDNAGGFQLKDSYVNYKWGNGWNVKAGQFKLPFLREEIISDTGQMAAERGLVNSAFTLERSQGVGVGYTAEDWRMWVAFSDGGNALNTDFNSGTPGGARPTGESDWAFTARAEFKLAGKSFEEFKDFTSKEGSDFAALLGVAGHYQGSANTVTAGDVDENYLGYTADITVKTGGLTAFLAFAGANTESRAGGTDTDLSDFGIVGQVAYRFTNTEPFVRYDGLFYDEDRLSDVTDEEDQGFLTVGVNHYFAGNAAKLTVDAVVSLDDSGLNGTPGIAPNSSASLYSTGQGLLASPDSGQIAVRAQFQLMF